MALQLNGMEFEDIRDDFISIDKDGDGQINLEEMLEFLDGNKNEYIDFMMKLMDTNCNGTIEFHEFLAIMAFLLYNKTLNIPTAGQFFRALDKDGDGYLSVAEIKQFYETMISTREEAPSTEDIEALVQSLDEDDDGKINFEEFFHGIDRF